MEFSVKMEFDERLHTYIYKVFIEKHDADGEVATICILSTSLRSNCSIRKRF